MKEAARSRHTPDGRVSSATAIRSAPLYEGYIRYISAYGATSDKQAANEAEVHLTVAGDLFDAVRTAPRSEKENGHVQARLEQLFLLDQYEADMFASALEQTKRRRGLPRDVFPLAQVQCLERSLQKTRITQQQWDRIEQFISLTIHTRYSLSEVLTECTTVANRVEYSRLAHLLRIGGFRPDAENNPFIATPAGSYIDLHIRRVSMNPMVQGIAMKHGLPAIKYTIAQLADHRKSEAVRGVSWLVQPKLEPLFTKAGWTRDKGVGFDYFDMEQVASDWNYHNDGFQHISRADVLRTGLENVILSPDHIQQFVHAGTLPDIGLMTIPRDALRK